MKSLSMATMLMALLCLLPGCVIARYTKTKPPRPPTWLQTVLGTNAAAGEKVTFSVYALFANEKVTKLAIDKATAKTSTGVAVGSAESDIDDQAIQAVVQGVVEGIIKGIK